MKSFYRVKFYCYQYNGGGSIRNGDQLITQDFNDLEDAKTFAAKVKSFLPDMHGSYTEGSREFARDYVWDGFVAKYIGIFKISEERLSNL